MPTIKLDIKLNILNWIRQKINQSNLNDEFSTDLENWISGGEVPTLTKIRDLTGE